MRHATVAAEPRIAPEDLSALRTWLSSYETHLRNSRCPRFAAAVLLTPLSPRYVRVLLRLSTCSLPKVAASIGAVGITSGLARAFSAGRGVCGWYVLLIFLAWLARRVASPLVAVIGSAGCFAVLFVTVWSVGDLISLAAILAAGLYGADMPGWD